MDTMRGVEQTMSVAEAAERLGVSIQDAYTLVFSKQLKSVEAPSGRRLIPILVVEEWLKTHPVSA
jgi:excisionase family DNA binding protein